MDGETGSVEERGRLQKDLENGLGKWAKNWQMEYNMGNMQFGKKKATLYDTQAPICPICQVLLRPNELQDHMEQELEKLTQNTCKHSMLKDSTIQGTVKPVLLSAPIKREGESPTASPVSADDTHHSDRYQGKSCHYQDIYSKRISSTGQNLY
ncbi:E3 ubiquitin-protein ligase RNF220-like [Chiloscyllium plagiosum]|uniref:E3 ubiquitin-protein ligase RNF220-like n=1 Tax=Chiloscyllium plagiosum TaxID=36176 RepID=UPI001CB87A61|nr:E3 ubiquitin-protein ligase RNF220-like [Chiloscyllium plagiosum]